MTHRIGRESFFFEMRPKRIAEKDEPRRLLETVHLIDTKAVLASLV